MGIPEDHDATFQVQEEDIPLGSPRSSVRICPDLEEKLREQRLKVDRGESKIVEERLTPRGATSVSGAPTPRSTPRSSGTVSPAIATPREKEATPPVLRKTITHLEDKMRERRMRIEQASFPATTSPATPRPGPPATPGKAKEEFPRDAEASTGIFSARGGRIEANKLAPAPPSPVPGPAGSERLSRVPVRDGLLASTWRLQDAELAPLLSTSEDAELAPLLPTSEEREETAENVITRSTAMRGQKYTPTAW